MNAMYTLDELTNEQAVGVNVFVAQLCRRLEILRCGPDIDTFTPGQLIDCLIVAIGESVGSPTDGEVNGQ